MDDLELLKATIAVAVADGELLRSERGVIEGLARRLGVGGASLEAMIEAVGEDADAPDNILFLSKDKARAALELVVAQARIDGEICHAERGVIARIAHALGIVDEELHDIYQKGVRRADALRRSRSTTGPAKRSK